MSNNLSINTSFNYLDLSISDQKNIQTCVDNYTLQGNLFEKITKIIHRIINAIKSLFDQSEWQITKRIIFQNITKFLRKDFSYLTKDINDLAECQLKIYLLNYKNKKIPSELNDLNETLEKKLRIIHKIETPSQQKLVEKTKNLSFLKAFFYGVLYGALFATFTIGPIIHYYTENSTFDSYQCPKYHKACDACLRRFENALICLKRVGWKVNTVQ